MIACIAKTASASESPLTTFAALCFLELARKFYVVGRHGALNIARPVREDLRASPAPQAAYDIARFEAAAQVVRLSLLECTAKLSADEPFLPPS